MIKKIDQIWPLIVITTFLVIVATRCLCEMIIGFDSLYVKIAVGIYFIAFILLHRIDKKLKEEKKIL